MTVTPDTFTSDKITFSDPKKNSQEKYVSKIMYGSGELLIQTPKMSCKIDKENRSLSLNVDDKSFYDFLGVFDEHVIQSLFASSKTWFNQELSEQQCKEIYKWGVEDDLKQLKRKGIDGDFIIYPKKGNKTQIRIAVLEKTKFRKRQIKKTAERLYCFPGMNSKCYRTASELITKDLLDDTFSPKRPFLGLN